MLLGHTDRESLDFETCGETDWVLFGEWCK